MRDYKFKTYDDCFSLNSLGSGSPLVFSNVEEAKNFFEYGRYLFTSGHQSPTQLSCDAEASTDAVQDHRSRYKVLMSNFLSALNAFADARGPLLTIPEDVAMTALRLHVLNTYVVICAGYRPLTSQAQQNDLAPMMEEMMLLSAKLVSSLSSGSDTEHRTASFCLDLGFIIPLFTVASQCTDKTLRRAAIALLRSTSRQEGLWNSLSIAKAAERIMEIEESEGMQLRACIDDTVGSTSSNVPTVLQLDGAGVRLQYVKGYGTDAYCSVVEEICIW